MARNDKGVNAVIDAFLPPYVTVPLAGGRQAGGYKCIVKKGDIVAEGQLISENGVFSPVPGKVEEIVKLPLADGSRGYCAKITTAGAFKYLGKRRASARGQEQEIADMGVDEKKGERGASYTSPFARKPEQNCKGECRPQDVLDTLRKKGVFNTFNSIRSLRHPHLLADDCNYDVNTIVVCLADEDPSVKTNSLLSKLFSDEIKQGAALLAFATGAKKVIFAGDEEQKALYEKGERGASYTSPCAMEFAASKFNRYPSAFESDLRQKILKASPAKEPSKSGAYSASGANQNCNDGVLFTDSTVMLACYDAILFDAPSMISYVYVAGEGLKAEGLFRVRVGTSIRFLADICGGLKKKCDAIIVNGFMTGFAASLDSPIDRYVKSLTFVPKGVMRNQGESECIMCGNCREVCPEHLLPDVLFRDSGKIFDGGAAFMGRNNAYDAARCTGCGLCNCVCPARLALVENIFEAGCAQHNTEATNDGE